MNLFAALLLTAAATAGTSEADGRGVQVASAQARATIVRAVAVRQASGLQRDDDAPAPQITRRGRTVLVEFQ
jgi:hypothetical protein